MPNNYVFSLQPTFTQGLILGQLSILVLLGMILKFLFLDSTQHPFESSSVDTDLLRRKRGLEPRHLPEELLHDNAESVEWFNVLLRQVPISPTFSVSSLITVN